MDFFADKTLQFVIDGIIKNKGEIPSCESIWFSLTRQMFKKYPTTTIMYQVQLALEQTAAEQWDKPKYPRGMFDENWEYPKKKTSILKKRFMKGKNTKIINEKLKIIDVAKDYGIIIKKGKAICPFHKDTDPSLSFSNEKNVFNCFGCGAKGGVVEFIRRMENVGNKKRG